ncbi:MAG: hypothetical protein Q8Q59_09325 [Luteolibacter sp.]|jgi:hypothetical protein|nr:hypothetical protein [Luteolibacter sp.]
MSRRRKSTDTTPFDTLRLEGSLFVPELLERAASGEATFQKEADYAIPKGLKLHDEYGRAFRIATATWQSFSPQTARADLDAAAVTRTFVVDFLRQCLGYTDLAPLGSPIQLGDRGFPVTAMALGRRLPVIIAPHSLGLDDPDPRFAIIGSGSRKKSAHQLAQEFLNASSDSLWAIVTNGKTLRLLRDADTLTRPNFLEFDLETILRDDQHRYADFSALWRILHASRAGEPTAAPAESIWEKWKSEGHAQGLRVRDGLRDGVTEAILILGRGFLTHPDNTALRQRLHDGTLTLDDYFQQFFRLIYRCLFLFCTEERDLLHPPDSSPAARQAYATGYSLRRLRRRALRQSAHDPHGDLWLSLRIVFRSLAGGQEKLALPALGGLFAETQCPDLDSASLSNRDLLSAMRELRWFYDKKTGKRSAIDYRNMGTEELGSVYESLLELVPTIDLPARTFGFVGITDAGSTSGNARKTTGSYYTADPLVMELIKSALEPVIRQRLADARELAAAPWATVAARIATDSVQRTYVHAWLVKQSALPADATPETLGRAWDAIPAAARANPLCAEALLHLTVCDPSCGSGHFLLAAARRLAETLAELRSLDGAVRPDDYRHALREVASRCLYGVDINPMAVELCRVALWLETVDPGKPLGFLNHHIRHGNSLLGTTPDLIAAGLPDETFAAIEGDDKPACAELKKRNKAERTGFGPLFAKEEDSIREKLRQAATSIEAMDDSQPAALQKKEAAFLTNETAPETRHAKLLADLWCAAFVIKKTIRSDETPVVYSSSQSEPPAPEDGQLLHTDDDLFGQPVPASKTTAKPKKPLPTSHFSLGTARGITTGTLRDYVQGEPLPEDLESEVNQLAQQYRFFHWHLAFPQVFDQGGFDCIIGNPPWERVTLKEKEWFTSRDPHVFSAATGSDRLERIADLSTLNPTLHNEFLEAKRVAAGEKKYLRGSKAYPLCGQGDVNTFAVFAELSWKFSRSRSGLVLPTGIVTADTTQDFAAMLVRNRGLASIFDFDNRSGIFPAVQGNVRFCLLTISHQPQDEIKAAAQLRASGDLNDEERTWTIGSSDIARINPNTLTLPLFPVRSDALLAQSIYRRHSCFDETAKTKEEKWKAPMQRMLHMGDDSHLFRNQARLRTEGFERNEQRWSKSALDYVPLFEAKLCHQFDHRSGTFEGIAPEAMFGTHPATRETSDSQHQDPDYFSTPRYWVPKSEIQNRIPGLRYLLGFRDAVSAVADSRSLVATIIPPHGAGDTLKFFFPETAFDAVFLISWFNAFPTDYIFRLKASGAHASFFLLRQLPCPSRTSANANCPWHSGNESFIDWLLPRVLELTYTAWDLEAFAADCGWPGPPFQWDEDRRFLLRCELDAAFFHLYLGSEDEWRQQPETLTRAFLTPRHAVSYIMDTFPIVKRKDEAKHGTYRTKETILQIYDALAESIATGIVYQTQLAPIPTDPRIAHMPRLPDIPRTAFAAQDYFEVVLPLMLSMAPEGLERARLFHAIELLTDPTKRTKAAHNLGDTGIQWSQAFREPYNFADAGKALITEVTKGRIRGVERMRLDPQAAVTTSNQWLCVDAFLALRLALEADVTVAQASEKTQQALVEQIIQFGKVA